MATKSAKGSGQGVALARAVMRVWLWPAERKRKKAIKEALATLIDVASKNIGRGFDASSTILNVGLFLLLAERDIQSLKLDALTHPDEWHRKLCARIIILTIYEWDFDKVTGKALKDALKAAHVSDESRQEAVVCLRRIRDVQHKVRKKFSSLRNSAIAHRDADGLAQYRVIQEVDEHEVFVIIGEFYTAARHFIDLLPKLVSESGNPTSLLLQWLQSDHTRS